MAQFEFGSVGTLSSTVTLIAFIVIVVFIIMFDAAIGVIEYLLGESKLYKRMIQTIYKELMLMGLISFIIVMINALESPTVINSFEGHRWIRGIEFSHILMFFLTFFYVAMAFFLIRNSIVMRSRYQAIFRESIPSVLDDAKKLNISPWKAFFYRCDYLNIFEVKERVELHLFNILFRDTYWMPKEFNVADYLSGCFDIYAQKTIERSYVGWALLLCLAVINYARVRSGVGSMTCQRVPAAAAAAAAGDHAAAATNKHHQRFLSGSQYDDEVFVNASLCNRNMVKLFLVCAATLCAYALIMVYFARLYRLRMLQRIGVNSADETITFLSFAQQEKDTANKLKKLGKYQPDAQDEMSNATLKEDIERVLDEDEHQGEEPEFKALAETILAAINAVNDGINVIQITGRRLYRTIFYGTPAKSNNGPSIALLAGNDAQDHSLSAAKEKDREKEKEKLGHNFHKASFASGNNRSTLFPPPMNATGSTSTLTASTSHISTDSADTVAAGVQSPMKASNDRSPENVPPSASPPKLLPPPSSSPQGLSTKENYARDHLHHHPSILHQQSVMSFLQTLEVQENNSTRRRLLLPTGLQSGSSRNITVTGRRPSGQTGAAAADGASDSPAAAGRGGRRQSVFAQAYQAVVNPHAVTITGNTNASENDTKPRQQTQQGRRNTVHVVAPENTLSIVEKFKANKRSKRIPGHDHSDSTSIARWWSLFRLSSVAPAASAAATTTNKHQEKDVEKGEEKSCLEQQQQQQHEDERNNENEDFHQIYLFNRPVYFFRGIETCILLTCLYLAFWLSEFVAITQQVEGVPRYWRAIAQILMLVPVVIVIPAISYISATAALLWAISELNLGVIYEILLAEEDTRKLVLDFRQKMYLRVQAIQNLDQDKDAVFEWLFQEIDQDGSGVVDKAEFRYLLRALKLTYSDDRFGRLFAAVDTSGDGEISLNEFKTMMTFSEEEIAEIQRIHGGGNGDKEADNKEKEKNENRKRHQNSFSKRSNRPTAYQDCQLSGSSGNPPHNGWNQTKMPTLEEIPKDDEKNDSGDDDDDDSDDEVITYMKPSRSRRSRTIDDHLLSLESIDYSDTDSENEGPNASPGPRSS